MAIVKSRRNLPGVGVTHFKHTSGNETIPFPIPPRVVIPMLQHMGAPCAPTVAKGEMVFVGQKIGECVGGLCAPIHSSCSGIVADIVKYHTVNGASCQAVVIETDGLQTLDKSCQKQNPTSLAELIEAVKQSGLVGLGGAGFPAHTKLAYKNIDSVKKLVINAAECEPYITADYRECIENTANIVHGVRVLKSLVGFDDIYIGIEDNKPEAIKLLDSSFTAEDHVTVVQLKSLYPQGAEKSIIYATTGIVVNEGMLPADAGVIVMNISSVGFIGSYLNTGIPLISKRITVDGDFVKTPKNLLVPIGTPIGSILDFCQISREECGKVLMGGPMMGIPVMDFDVPLIKNNNAIIAISHKGCEPMKTTACIRCGKCIGICPMNLMPARLEKAYDTENIEALNSLHISLCINCGCCTFICPAKRHLAQKNQLSKLLIRQRQLAAKAREEGGNK